MEDARYGQFTYTADGRGYGVKARSGRTEDWVESQMVSHLSAQAGFGREMPTYPTLRDEPLPRRCVWAPVAADGPWGLWHSVHAGVDATGRANNVFTHCVVDWAPRSTDGVRPIDWWRSPDLLAPRGVAEVAAAVPHEGAPVPGTVITAAESVEFLLGDSPSPRLDVLQVLLDALRTAGDEPRPVVLVTESTETAASWVGLITRCMSPGAARQFAFSLLELPADRAGFARVIGRGLDLVCVPRANAASVKRDPRFLLLDDLAPVEIGVHGGRPHRLATGETVEVTAWSVLAEGILGWPDGTHELDALDRLAQEAGDVGLDPAWPLALFAALHLDQFPQLKAAAAEVLTTCSPDITFPPSWTAAAVGAVTRPTDGAAELWRRLGTVRRLSPVVRLLWDRYVLLASQDAAWWLDDRSRECPLVPLPVWTEDDYDRLGGAIGRLSGDPAAQARACVNVILARAGQEGVEALPSIPGVQALIDEILVPALLEQRDAREAARLPRLSGPLASHLRTAFERDPRLAGSTLLFEQWWPLLVWLVPDYADLAAQRAPHTRVTALAVCAAAKGCTQFPKVSLGWRASALGEREAGSLLLDPERRDLADRLWPGMMHENTWLDPDDFRLLLRHFPTALPAERLMATLLAIPDDAERLAVAAELPRSSVPYQVTAAYTELCRDARQRRFLTPETLQTIRRHWAQWGAVPQDEVVRFEGAVLAATFRWRTELKSLRSARWWESPWLDLWSQEGVVEALTYFQEHEDAADACAADALTIPLLARDGARQDLEDITSPEIDRFLDGVVLAAGRGARKRLLDDALAMLRRPTPAPLDARRYRRGYEPCAMAADPAADLEQHLAGVYERARARKKARWPIGKKEEPQ